MGHYFTRCGVKKNRIRKVFYRRSHSNKTRSTSHNQKCLSQSCLITGIRYRTGKISVAFEDGKIHRYTCKRLPVIAKNFYHKIFPQKSSQWSHLAVARDHLELVYSTRCHGCVEDNRGSLQGSSSSFHNQIGVIRTQNQCRGRITQCVRGHWLWLRHLASALGDDKLNRIIYNRIIK